MRVRLILGHGGHSLSKVVELPTSPAVGSVVMAERERQVVTVECTAERSEADVYLREDAEDLTLRTNALLHLAYINMMKTDGWEITEEQALRAWLRGRISGQGGGGPIAQF